MDSVPNEARQIEIRLHPNAWKGVEVLALQCDKSVDDIVNAVFSAAFCIPGGDLPPKIDEWRRQALQG